MDSAELLLRKDEALPLPGQISGILRERIVSGEYAPGKRLGSVRQFAGDFDVSSAAVKTATNASRTAVSCFVVVASAGRCDSTASNLNVTAAVVFCSSNTCTLCAASRRQRAFFASIILNGQCTLRVAVVLLDACVVSAALQLVLAVQLQPDVAVAFYLEGGVFVRLDADVLEGHVRGLPPPPDLIVTVFFSDLPVMTVSVSRTVSLSP